MTFMRPPPGAGLCISGSMPEGGQITPFELASLSLRLELDPSLSTVGAHGACAALLGLATGVTKILGTGRNSALLERVKALAPARIEVFAVGKRLVQEWAMEATDNEGVDAVIDTLPPGAPASAMLDALRALRRGGRAVDVGGVAETLPLNVHWMMGMNIQLIGSCWFTTGEGQEMAEMARVGTLDLSVLEHRRISLRDVNDALSSLQDANRGFNNFVVIP